MALENKEDKDILKLGLLFDPFLLIVIPKVGAQWWKAVSSLAFRGFFSWLVLINHESKALGPQTLSAHKGSLQQKSRNPNLNSIPFP